MTDTVEQASGLRASIIAPETRKLTVGGGSFNSRHLAGEVACAARPCAAGGLVADNGCFAPAESPAGASRESRENAALSVAPNNHVNETIGESAADVRRLQLTGAQVRVLGIIAAAGGGLLTKDQLAELAQCSRKTVDRAVSRLTRDGLLQVRPRYAADGAQLANEYLIPAFFNKQPNTVPEFTSSSACASSCTQNALAP